MRLVYFILFAALISSASVVFAQSAQKRFNEGTQALQNEDYEKALTVFGELEDLSIKDINVQAVIKIRKGEALYYLNRGIEAQSHFSQALENIDHKAPNYRPDIFSANNLLGKIAFGQFEYGAATQYYLEAVKAAPNAATKLNVMAGATMASIFVDSDQALRIAIEANELAKQSETVSKDIQAQAEMMLGRVYLNQQQFSTARRHFNKAVLKLGGLTRRVKLNDIQARSDHATASALMDDPAKMRHYLSYTGAGRFEGSAFLQASDVQLPACDPQKNIMPDDVVVIELGITKLGEVFYSRPIYSNKPEVIAIPFAKAVKNWSWTQQEVATIDPFYRAMTRLELRCTQKTPAQPNPRSSLYPAFAEWIDDNHIARPDNLADAAFAIRLRKASEGIEESEVFTKRATAIWTQLAMNSAITVEKRAAYVDKAVSTAKQLSAPIEALAFLKLLAPHDDRKGKLKYLKALKDDKDLNTNEVVNAVLSLSISDVEKRGANADYIVPLLQEVIDDSRLVSNHPLKIGAQVRLASLYQQLNEEEFAKQTFQKTGLAANQCAAVDSKPKLLSTGSISKLYPSDMLRMGISGFSKAEYDITADGRVTNQRIVMAYPPFGFTDASEKIIGRGRYEKSYRPDGGLGCSNDTNFIKFEIPGSPS